MNILILDTSGPDSYVALFRGETLLASHPIPPKDQVKTLIPTIHLILSEYDITLEEIGLIKVCIGPGSFTGTRVGVITAKGLAYGAAIPIVGFHSQTKAEAPSLEIVYLDKLQNI